MDLLKHAFRSLRSSPGFAIVAVVALALGIGANSAIFSIVNAIFLRPLPFPDADTLVLLDSSLPERGLENAGFSWPRFLAVRERQQSFSDIAVSINTAWTATGEGDPEQLIGQQVSQNFFHVLGVQPSAGRDFLPEEDRAGAENVAILSTPYAERRFGRAEAAVGKSITLDGRPFLVVGVMPRSVSRFPMQQAVVWAPRPDEVAFLVREQIDQGGFFYNVLARLKPGVSVEQARNDVAAIASGYAQSSPRNSDAKSTANVNRWLDTLVGNESQTYGLLFAAVACVLLIACANVANLMLTRVSARQKELSVRTALGAGRFRIARQLIIESMALSLMGGVAGILIAYFSLGLLGTLGLNQSQLSGQVGIDPLVLAFTLAISAVTGLLFGLVPALTQLGGKPYEVLKEGGRGNTVGKGAKATRSTLVVVQMALAVTLLVGAGLLIKSFQKILDENPGFARDGRMTVRFDLPEGKYPELQQQSAFYTRSLTELRAIPGVTAAGYTSNLPFGQSNWTSSYEIEGRETPDGESGPHGYGRVVDEDFFKAMDIPVLAGRTFQPSDEQGAEQVIVIDEVLAKKYFKDESPIGKRIVRGEDSDPNRFWTIIGVVGTVKNINMAGDVTKESYYFTYRQFAMNNGFFVVKSNLPLGGLVQPIRDAVLRVDPEQPLYDIKSLDERIAVSLDSRRAPMILLAVFAGVALLLAAIGIYGVLAFSVAQRTGELGVRMAIGARSSDIVSLVIGQGVKLAAIGLGIGIVGSLVLTRFMEAQLFNVKSGDPVTLIAVVAVLGIVAMVACWLPARRAAKTSPIEALRYE